jgi:hypothetical protein
MYRRGGGELRFTKASQELFNDLAIIRPSNFAYI